MKVGHYKILKKTPYNNTTFKLDCSHVVLSQLKKKVTSYSVDTSDASLDTWEEVVKDILDIHTDLPSHNIVIEDVSGSKISSDDWSWKGATILEMIKDICQLSESVFEINEYDIPYMRTLATSFESNVCLERSVNIVKNEIAEDVTKFVNHARANLTYLTDGTLLETRGGSGLVTANTSNATDFLAQMFVIPLGTDSVSSAKFRIRKVNTPANVEFRLLYAAAAITEPPDWADSLGNGTITAADVTTSYQWLEFDFAADIDVTGNNNDVVWLAIDDQSDGVNYYEWYLQMKFGFGDLFKEAFYDADGSAPWTGHEIVGNGYAHHAKLYGKYLQSISGSYLDENSIQKYGETSKSFVAKGCRSNDACDILCQRIVDFYKDGIKVSTCTIPSNTVLYPGMRIIIDDEYNNLDYEDFFISSIIYTPSSIDVAITEPDLDIPESVDTLDSEQSKSDSMLLT